MSGKFPATIMGIPVTREEPSNDEDMEWVDIILGTLDDYARVPVPLSELLADLAAKVTEHGDQISVADIKDVLDEWQRIQGPPC